MLQSLLDGLVAAVEPAEVSASAATIRVRVDWRERTPLLTPGVEHHALVGDDLPDGGHPVCGVEGEVGWSEIT